MKILLLTLSLALSSQAFADKSPLRQSYFSIVGLIQRLHQDLSRKSVPLKNVRIDYEDTEITDLLRSSGSEEERVPHSEGTFSFTNSKTEIASFYVDMGLCRGYSSIRRKMRFMAFFDASSPAPEFKTEKEKRRYYRKLIRQIRNFRPQIITGFSSLQEMSQDPVIEKVLQWQVLHEWRNKNFFKGTGTRDLLRGTFKPSSYSSLLKVRERIAKNAQLQHNTMVWLSQKKSSWIHVLEAFAASPVAEDGSFKIYFWNDKFIDPSKAHSVLSISGDGKLTYDDFLETRSLHAMGITNENDGEMILLSKRREEFCRVNSALCL